MPKPSWSDTPESDPRTPAGKQELTLPLMVERLTLGGDEQDYHGYAEQHLKKQRKLGRRGLTRLITPPGTKVRVQLKKGDDLPEINMISFGRQKLKPRRKKISQQELQDPSDKADYHVPRPKERRWSESLFYGGLVCD